ncbi:MAG: insulinase family protein [Fusicatenibacter sp.]
MKIQNCEAYELVKEQQIDDVHAKGFLLRHKKTGARVLALETDDENKVFNIAFRTPPSNSTGVAHILEHSVLCGSREFPLKDPFVELVKGSLNTFLNAMTYPDKTMYPVASCNDADFQNLMHVFLDAVFYPNIYNRKEIFHQEGWSYHLESMDGPLTYNGVVYNEMKGAFSSADEVLSREIFNTLFPDSPYGVESGGDPECIPDLTYEEFLDFHRKYYHPSNSYIYLYGNMDMEEKLNWMDETYLSHFDARPVDSAIPMQAPFDKIRDITKEYPVLEGESTEENSYLSYNLVIGDGLDVKLNIAFSVLEYALLDAPGAPVKQALLDAHIGKDVYGSYEDGILQPYLSIVAKNAKEGEKDRFLSVIRETLEQIVKNGIDQKAIEAGINYFEFRFREADYASFPKGLIYGIDVFDSWLYADDQPFSYLEQLSVYEELKKLSGEGYFEDLIRRYLLENSHASVVTLIPKTGLAAEREERTAQKLSDLKVKLSREEQEEIIRETAALRAYQEEEETEEALESIPLLSRSDIRREAVKLYNEEHTINGTTVLHHRMFTNGIGYLTLLFDTKEVPDELVSYMGILKSVLGYVDTEHYTYGELFNEINAKTGGINCGLQVFRIPGEETDCRRMFGVRAKFLEAQLPFVIRMIKEILVTSRLDDEKRLYEILSSTKSNLQNRLSGAGNSTAVMRACSYYSPLSSFQDRVAGISFYYLVKDLEEHFQERKEELIEKLKKLLPYIFRPENLTISYTSEESGLEVLKEEVAGLKESLFTEAVVPGSIRYELTQKNEAFQTSGQVQYVALCGNFKAAGYSYTGALRILRVMLSYDYLWNNIRVKGGAYGCGGSFGRSGDACISSYRDPNLGKSLDVYRGIADYIRSFDADEREMTKYIIGTISELDVPMNPAAKGQMSESAWFHGITEEDLQKERDEVLNATPEDIRSLADLVEAALAQNNICVIGSEAAIQKEKGLFGAVENL